MSNITFIGDLHGEISAYNKYIQFMFDAPITNALQSIQVGDFGLDFVHNHYAGFGEIAHTQHKVLFGNHDWYPNLHCRYSLGDYGQLSNFENVFFVRGAMSIDKRLRHEGINYFAQEQLTYAQMQNAIDLYAKVKPSIVISHTCPSIVKETQFGLYGYENITESGLNEMFGIHAPDLWIFGHMHQSKQFNFWGTEFKCLGIEEYWTIDL
jgi:hypothetical protein